MRNNIDSTDDSHGDTKESHSRNNKLTQRLMRYNPTHILISAFRIVFLSNYGQEGNVELRDIKHKEVRKIISDWDPKLRVYERFYYCCQYQEITGSYNLTAQEIREANYSSTTFNRTYHELCALLRYLSREKKEYYQDCLVGSHYGKTITDQRCASILEDKTDPFLNTTEVARSTYR